MSISNQRITAPVDAIRDVSYLLGANNGDVTTLCMHDGINPAALYCPRRSPYPYLDLKNGGFETLADQDSHNPNQNIYKCIRNYAVWVPELPIRNVANTSTFFTNCFSAASNEWFIARPDANSYKCLVHFDGYKHDAKATNPIVSTSASRTGGKLSIAIILTTPGPDDATLSVSNLFPGWYFGAIVFRGTDEEGWHDTDTIFVAGASTPIGTDPNRATASSITITDDTANASTLYYYRIIPFVCNKKGVTKSTVIDTTFYGLKIDKTVASFKTMKSDGTSTGHPGYQYFLYNEGGGDNRYPVPGLILDAPSHDIAVAYAEPPVSGRKLYEYYNRVDLVFNVIVGGNHQEYTYTWRKSGSVTGDLVLVRDSQYDNRTGADDRLLFYIPSGKFWLYIQSLNGTSNIFISDMYGRFYYTVNGNNHVDEVFAEFVPDTET